MKIHLPFVLALASLGCAAACRGPEPAPGPGDSAADDTSTLDGPYAFDEGTLDPAFEHANAVWSGAALLDYDLDGWLDIFFTNGENHPDALYRNQGDGTFVDMAAEAGVDSLIENGAVVSGDLDNDGDPDLIVNSECSTGTFDETGLPLLDGGKILYINNGDGTFTQKEFEVKGDLFDSLSWCATSLGLTDWNGDGALDLVISNGFDPDLVAPWVFFKTEAEARNVLLYNDGQGGFHDGVIETGEAVRYAATFTSAIFDVDGDGQTELIAGQGGQYLHVYPHRDDGSLNADVRGLKSQFSETGAGLWMGLAVADFDGDQDFDIYASNQGLSTLMAGYDNTAGVLMPSDQSFNIFQSMLLWDGTAFRPSEDWTLEADQVLAGDLFDGFDGEHEEYMHPEGLARQGWGWGVAALDVDSDGWVDVAWTGNNCSPPLKVIWDEEHGASPGGLLRNTGGTGFEDITWQAGVANIDDQGRYVDGRGLAVGDLNNDGYSDIVVVNRNYNPSQSDPLAQVAGRPRIWLSRPRENHWLQIDLVGTTSNRDGLGATVSVFFEEGVRRYIFGAEGSTNASNERLLTLGLGDHRVVRLEVTFPSGVKALREVDADQRITIVEGE